MTDRKLLDDERARQEAAPTSASPSIFRTEALEAAADRLSSPVAPLGLASWLSVTFMVLLIVASTVFVALARYDRTETVQGFLEPAMGDAKLVAFKPGQVEAVLAKDGELVRRGQAIITLVTDGQTEERWRNGEAIQASLSGQIGALERQSQAMDRIRGERSAANAVRRASLKAENQALGRSRDLQAQRVALARESLEAIRALAERGVGSPLQVRQREDALLLAEQDLAALDKQILQAPLGLASFEADARRTDQEDLQQIAILDQKRQELEERRIEARGEAGALIAAPIAGRLTALEAKAGSQVGAGQTLAVIVPDQARLQGVFWAPSRSIGFVRPKDPVRLKYAAYPYEKFGVAQGTVIEVAQAPTGAYAPEDKPAEDGRRFRVVVALDRQDIQAYGRKWPLTSGMAVTGDIVLEKQSLLDWLYENLRAMGKSQ